MRLSWYVISAFAVTLILSISYGFQWRVALPDVFVYFLSFSLAFFACVVSTFLSAVRPLSELGTRGRIIDAAAYSLAGLSLLSTLYFYSSHIPNLGLFYAGAVALMALGASYGAAAIPALAVAAPAVVGYVGLQVGDSATMFAIIEAACTDAIIGKNPWIEGYTHIAPDLPFYYLPLLPLPYCGAVLVGLDFQVLNLMTYFALVAVTVYLVDPSRGQNAVLFVILGFLVSPVFPLMISTVHLWFYWLTIILFTFFFLEKRYLVAALLMGVLLATRQMALIIALPILCYLLKDVGLRRCLGYVAAALLVFAVVMVPVILATPGYIDLVYLDLPGARKGGDPLGRNPFDQISLASPFFKSGIGSVLTAVQIGICVTAALVVLLWRRISAYQAILLTALSYILTVSLSSFLLRYFYIGGLLMILFSVAFEARRVTAVGTAGRKAPTVAPAQPPDAPIHASSSAGDG